MGRRSQGHASVTLHTDAGHVVAVDAARWHRAADEADLSTVARAVGPTLDVGCGPGRIVAALRDAGVDALGIDVSPAAVGLAHSRGAAAIEADVFGALPASGSWATAMLLDGNIGIGGDPVGLLRRLGDVVAPGGTAVVETEPPDAVTDGRQFFVSHEDGVTDWFDWARVTVSELASYALAAGWQVSDTWCVGARWFSLLSRAEVDRSVAVT